MSPDSSRFWKRVVSSARWRRKCCRGRSRCALLLDKTEDMNWALGWHQDRTIAVREKIETPGYGPWTVKAGFLHVAPPFDVLAHMVTLRVHLDPVPADNAPLRVVPGSHLLGRIAESDVPDVVRARVRRCVSQRAATSGSTRRQSCTPRTPPEHPAGGACSRLISPPMSCRTDFSGWGFSPALSHFIKSV